MKDIKFKKFPVVDMSDFEMVCIDVTVLKNKTYTVMLSFFKNFADDDKSARGFVLNTHMGGASLSELYFKINNMYNMGMFNGVEVAGTGTLYDHNGEKIDMITWHDYSDEFDDEDITDEVADLAGRTLH